MKQISFFTRGTMAALTKEEGGPLSCSASSHPTSVPRINPFHLGLCGDTTPELRNKGGRKAPPCPGWARGGGDVPVSLGWVSLISACPCPCPFSSSSYLLPCLRGVSFVLPHLLFLRDLGFAAGSFTPGALGASASQPEP